MKFPLNQGVDLLQFSFLLLGLSVAYGAEAPAQERPEGYVLARNFMPDGRTPYDFESEAVTAETIRPVASGVEVTFADGHRVVAPLSGQVVLEVLRNGHEQIAKNTFLDALAATFLVQATPEQINEAVRDVTVYPRWFNKKKQYCHTFYTDGRILDRSKHEPQAEALAENEKVVGAALTKKGFVVDAPESNLIQLALTVGRCNFIVKSDATPVLLTTCYRVRDGKELVAILNENSLAWPDETGGAQSQNVVWIIEPVPGKGTLVRYIYASEIVSGRAALVVDDRWDMVQKNISEFASGIRDRALDIKKNGGARMERGN